MLFGVGRALGVTANLVWARALGQPIASAERRGQPAGGHGAGHTDLALASNLRTTDGRVLLIEDAAGSTTIILSTSRKNIRLFAIYRLSKKIRDKKPDISRTFR